MEKREPFCTVGGNVNWYSHCEEQYGGSLKKQLRTELPYDPAILFMGIYPEETYFEEIHTSQCYCSTIYNNQDVEAT